MVVTLNSFHFYVPLLLLTNLYSQTFWTKTLMRGERSKFIMCISHAIIIDVSAYIIFTIWRIHLGASWFSSKVKKTFWHHYHVCNITIKHAHFNTRMPFSLHLNKSYLFHINASTVIALVLKRTWTHFKIWLKLQYFQKTYLEYRTMVKISIVKIV